MRISLKLDDFISSEYHKETTDFLSGILLSDLHPDIWNFDYITKIPTPLSYYMSSGKKEIFNFVRDGLEIREDVVIDFEDFSVHVPLQYEETHEIPEDTVLPTLGLAVFISARRVWLPRKKELKLRYYEELECYDSAQYCVYVIEKTLLPVNKRDVYKFLKWLRLKKRILFPPDHKKWCRGFWRSGDKLMIIPEDHRHAHSCPRYNIDVSQKLMGEFIDWQKNRYKITK